MRISGGLAKGRRTATKHLISKTSGHEKLRPTSSKVREALFDILRDRIDGADFVDLYAGTGTVGLEALSRGAAHAVFVEPDRKRAKALRVISGQLQFDDRATIIEGKAADFLRTASRKKARFDIIFIDPPYSSDEILEILPLIEETDILEETGTVIVEHFIKTDLPEAIGKYNMLRNYRYGDTVLTLYRRKENI
jgi:16S rRNA (guanine(966)-N(2))-methyltransferase RsmD